MWSENKAKQRNGEESRAGQGLERGTWGDRCGSRVQTFSYQPNEAEDLTTIRVTTAATWTVCGDALRG